MRKMGRALLWVWERYGDVSTALPLLPKPVSVAIAGAESMLIGWLGYIRNLGPIAIIFLALTGACLVLLLAHLWLSVITRWKTSHHNGHNPVSAYSAPQIEILFESREPYERTEIIGAGTMSKVMVGIVNSGGSILSNCIVQITKVVPPQHLYGGLPMQLHLESFTLRADDRARAVEVAYRTKGSNQFRFAVPYTGGFGETLNFLDTKETLTIEIRVTATECQRAAIFNVWTDDNDHLRMKFLSYVA